MLRALLQSATFKLVADEADLCLVFVTNSDAYLITFWVVLFWFLREASMRWLWEPLARKLNLKEGKTKVRFAEQGWNLLYYSVFWSLGLVSIIYSLCGYSGRVRIGEAGTLS